MQKLERFAIILNMAFVLASCGAPQRDLQGQNIDGALVSYLTSFEREATRNGVSVDSSHLTMSFSESMPQSTVGGYVLAYCQRTLKGPNVVVKGSYWNQTSVSDREQLIFHELGHCLLGLDHDDSTEAAPVWNNPAYQANNVPSSIMNTFHFDSGLYNGNRPEYVNRLFNARHMPLYWNAPSQFDDTIYF